MNHGDDRRPGSYDPRTWENVPRYDPSTPPAKDRPRPVLHTAGVVDPTGDQRCVRCGCPLPRTSPAHAPGTVVALGEGKSFDGVVCVGPRPR
jgi:hypothetical protein